MTLFSIFCFRADNRGSNEEEEHSNDEESNDDDDNQSTTNSSDSETSSEEEEAVVAEASVSSTRYVVAEASVSSTRYAMMGELAPVHHCRNAFKVESECVLAMCNDCYVATKQPKRRRVHCGTGNDQDSSKKECDHANDVLRDMGDKNYYTEAYLSLKRAEHAPYPYACIKCNRAFTIRCLVAR